MTSGGLRKGIRTSFNNIDTRWIPSFALPQEQQNCIVRQRSKIFSIFDLGAITFQNNAYWLRGGDAKFVFTCENNDFQISTSFFATKNGKSNASQW